MLAELTRTQTAGLFLMLFPAVLGLIVVAIKRRRK